MNQSQEPPHDWVGLRDYVDAMFTMNGRMWTARLNGLESSIMKAERALDIRLEGMNEFRRQLEMNERRYAQRLELDGLQARMLLHMDAIEKRMDTIEKGMAFNAGRLAAAGAMFVGGAAIAGIAVRFWT